MYLYVNGDTLMVLLPDEPTDEEKLEQEQQDGQTPFRPADNASYQGNQTQASMDPLEPTDDGEGGVVVTEGRQVLQPDVGGLSSTHPQTDTNVLREEQYDEGVSGAAEAGEPDAENAVTGYDRSRDARRQNGRRDSSEAA